jgi:primary-amine oxidase
MNTTALRPGEESPYGVEIAPQLKAGHHQHTFAARLIPCIDGPGNVVYEVNTSGVASGPENRHGNAFVAEETLLATEKQARRRVNSSSARFWRIKNPEIRNRLGKPVAYRLIPGENSPPMAQPDAEIMRRAGFTTNHLWVTPLRADERFAAGEYPNQHPTGDGLPVWTQADRPIENTELSVWYVFSHTHIPRLEDWPVMPVSTIGFHLKPDGFFERSPALDLPPTMQRTCCKT